MKQRKKKNKKKKNKKKEILKTTPYQPPLQKTIPNLPSFFFCFRTFFFCLVFFISLFVNIFSISFKRLKSRFL